MVGDLVRGLCQFASGVVAPDNEALFARIAQELPIELHRYPSGAEHNGWLVPDMWRVHKARIDDYDATAHPLDVAAYSRSFQGTLNLEQLRPHLITNPELPNALVWHSMWQYRPWDADWAISMPYVFYETLRDGFYEVELETSYEPGEMLVATYEHRGASEETIVLNAHTCHPCMANDDMAGVAVLIRLFQELGETRYTYRLVLGPEHLGTIFYLSDHGTENLIGGAFCEMPGTQGPVTVASPCYSQLLVFNEERNLIEKAFRHSASRFKHRFVPWRQGAGNDETVWEAHGVPFVEISRSEDLLKPFREYHTSLDTPDLMDELRLRDFLEVFRGAIEIIETDRVPVRKFTGLPCLSRYGLYPERPDPAVNKNLPDDAEAWGYLSDCLPSYLDGSMTILDIADRHDLSFWEVRDWLKRWEEKGLLEVA